MGTKLQGKMPYINMQCSNSLETTTILYLKIKTESQYDHDSL